MVSFYKPGKKRQPATSRPASRRRTDAPRRSPGTPVSVDSWDWQGQGVVREHPVLFVAGALPGERCSVAGYREQKQVAYGKVKDVITPAAERQMPFCPLADQCGGCQLQHVSADEALTWRQEALDTLWQKQFSVTHIPWQPAVTGPRPAYRRKARLAVDARDPHNIRIGYRQANGHDVVDVPSCPVLTPTLNALLPSLREALCSYPGIRHVGHIALMQGDNCARVTIKVTRTMGKEWLSALTVWGRENQVNVVLEDKDGGLNALHEQDTLICETEAGLSVSPGPNDFIQVNAEVNRKMVAQAMQWLNPAGGEHIADWFSGLGNFSLSLAQRGARVQAVEGVPDMVRQAAENAQRQGITGIDWQHHDLQQSAVVRNLVSDGLDKVLLDPSREGAATVCEVLADSEVKQILYISCNPSTFTRDAKTLLAGNYQLEKVGVLEMFPYTKHLEVMALFTR